MAVHEMRAERIAFERRSIINGQMLGCEPHFHAALEFVLILEGSVEAHADAQKYQLHAGDVYLSFPNQVHFFENDSPDQRCWIAIVPLSMCSDYKKVLRQYLPATNRIPASKVSPQVGMLLEQMKAAEGAYAESMQKGYWLAILGLLLPHMELTPSQGNENDVLRSLLNYCIENLNGDLRLDEVAERVCVGKYYISHLFSEKLGLRFNDYVNSLRISEACRYLLNSDYSITEISEIVGFNTLRTFNRAFIKQIGVSPSDYRKNEAISTKRQKGTIFVGDY